MKPNTSQLSGILFALLDLRVFVSAVIFLTHNSICPECLFW